MSSSKVVEIIFVVFVVFGSTLQDKCWEYGNCDPGPNCTNNVKIGENLWKTKCFNCCDYKGYFTFDKACDTVNDCKKLDANGKSSDERYCPNKNIQSGVMKCLMPKEYCIRDSECCSGSCNDGKCWDDDCV